jgi:endonuclease-3
MAAAVVERHRGEIPKSMDELTELPGVGRKTANVVLGHAMGVPGLPVDRHVLRVSNRIGIAASEDAVVVEQQLCAALPPARWTKASDTLILHGRRICKPRPLCDQCAVRDDCLFYQATLGARRRAESPQMVVSRPKRSQAATRRHAPAATPPQPGRVARRKR